MALETGSYIGDLVSTNPTSSDPKSQGDDHVRLIKSALKQCFSGFSGAILITGTDGGAVNAYTVTPSPAQTAYTTKSTVLFFPTITNTGAATLNVSGLGAKTIKTVSGADVTSGDLVANVPYFAVYDGTNFRLTSITKNYADQLAFAGVLPNQSGNSGKFLKTDGTNASWADAKGMTRSARTSNTQLTSSDVGAFIDITSGTFTQTFDACASLGSNWYVYLRNAGTGDITLDPSGAETIDSLSNFIMYPNEVRLIQCDGSALRSFVIAPFYKQITSSITFTTPPGYSLFEGIAWSGGASGQKSGSLGTTSNGGAGGGAFPFSFPSSAFGSSISITIGAGGAAVTGTAGGNNGGSTSIGSLMTVNGATYGGAGGAMSGVANNTNGTPARGFETTAGGSSTAQTVWGGTVPPTAGAQNSQSSIYGGAAGGVVFSDNTAYNGGSSVFGGRGGNGSSASSGQDGTAPAGGGGATQTGTQSGAGARGEVRIWGVA